MTSSDLLLQLKQSLNKYLDSVEKSTCVFISTMDGHLLLDRSRANYDVQSISPMAGSLLGISETIANTLMNQRLDDAIIMMNENTLGLLKIQDSEDSLYLGIISPRQVNLGKLLVNGRETIAEIKELIEGIPK
ncbi:MAG: hypothetical protein KDI92_11745 [Xanthomonadales bacterium]|nr:hypothetical protein [Xanthomonadales bacterium]